MRKKLTPTQRLKTIREIIEQVDSRCIAVDGPVSKTLEEMTDEEMRRIYRLAKGSSQNHFWIANPRVKK